MKKLLILPILMMLMAFAPTTEEYTGDVHFIIECQYTKFPVEGISHIVIDNSVVLPIYPNIDSAVSRHIRYVEYGIIFSDTVNVMINNNERSITTYLNVKRKDGNWEWTYYLAPEPTVDQRN